MRKSIFLLQLLLSFLFAFISTSTFSQQGHSKINGTVKDESTGELLSGAVVELLRSSDTTSLQVKLSDSTSNFLFSNLKKGNKNLASIILSFNIYLR